LIYPKSIATLIEQFQKFPSDGPKSAQRMAFQVLKMPYTEVEKFANAIEESATSITPSSQVAVTQLKGSREIKQFLAKRKKTNA
jgi:recombination protein RecR